MDAYVNGVSTRSVDDLVAAFRTRRLDHIEFPDVYLDATHLNVRNQTPQVVSTAVIVATSSH
jgi:putative transposase